ncbi:hypothetical protein GCM10011609_49130 [Lentzea pudingi]|uniref:site-specific DNA-methyltransferase (adenine-specific) n=1 Tax=Lentzea pudingi TaxID=1789439 RepID=A0ABQ2ICC6_9PSEU|nr:N-6 DNA methylase [Lentzea pudingi]GGN04095.1 hypothetical protein GCM10011609_49130 [Lentzea pudingi]
MGVKFRAISPARIKKFSAGDARSVDIRSAGAIEHGEVFTRRWVAEVMLDLVGYTADRELVGLKLVEPACGAGAFLVPAVERLAASVVDRGRVLDDSARSAVQAFDVQDVHVERCRAALIAVLRRFGVREAVARELAHHWVRRRDYLLSARANADLIEGQEEADVDVIVGNPPYIRFESVEDEFRLQYRSRWPTMKGRADVYVGFYERALRSLKPDGGRLAFICSDRWMRNQYGGELRKLVARDYRVEAVWSMHDVNAFEKSVSAYPAITILSRGAQGEAVVAETTRQFTEAGAQELTAWTLRPSSAETKGVGYRAFRFPGWFPGDEMWPAGDPAAHR